MTREKEEEDMADIHPTNKGKLTPHTRSHKVVIVCLQLCNAVKGKL